MWVWFVGVAMGVAYVLEASLKKLAPMHISHIMTLHASLIDLTLTLHAIRLAGEDSGGGRV